MFSVLSEPRQFDEICPERREFRGEEWLDRMGTALTGKVARLLRSRPGRIRAIVQQVGNLETNVAGLDDAALKEEARELKMQLRRHGLTDELVARAFALVRETSKRVLGKRHFDVQLIGGYILLNGMIAEMNTGEGKTLTATLPACTAALAGIPVHVITVNDYLVERDCELMRPVYEGLGLTVAFATAEMEHAERQAAYLADVVYVSNKTVVFDYLRDRILLASGSSSLHLKLEKMYGNDSRSRKLLLRGLHFAIVDEADSVLADEARTPLIISASVESPDEALVAKQALELAHKLVLGEDFLMIPRDRRAVLTESGDARVIELCKAYGGVWAGSMRRAELIVQALTALHLFNLDEHYIIREGKIVVVDESTGRVMADRSWGQGLHQLIETKENLELTPRKEPMARISYQRFFRRYLHLSGMTGTGDEVASELGTVYGLAVARVPLHRPSKRVYRPDRIFQGEKEKWAYIAERVAELNAKGVPILLGTRSVAASEMAGSLLAERGLEHYVLNAKQDSIEAELVARAGDLGRITIATNMAGRGTDIELHDEVRARGGLHVILSERHEAGRIDRQLAGRSARQGDPGHFEAILSLEDAMLEPYHEGPFYWMAKPFLIAPSRIGDRVRKLWVDFVQYRIERTHSKMRKGLLKTDKQMGDILSFTGRPE